MTADSGGALDVVAFGEVLIDMMAPDAVDLQSATEFLPAPGGAPANVAVAAARLGARTGFVGAVGDDPFGRLLGSVLQAEGIDLSGLRTVQQRTTLAFVAKNMGGIPDFVFYRGADAELQPSDIPAPLLARTGIVYASSMALMSERSSSATFYAIEAAHEAGSLVAIDPNLRPTSWPSLETARDAIAPLLRDADIIKVNDEEAKLLTGRPILQEAMAGLAGDETLLVVTLGARGCMWQWGGERGTVSTPQVTVRDTTGAGDAFVGAMLAEITARGLAPSRFAAMDRPALEEIVRFACAAGALACAKPGAMSSLPARNDVEQFLNRTG